MKRGYIDIIADILRVAEKGSIKSHIVYGADLNFKMFERYIEEINDSGLIRRNRDGKFETTEKGLKFLKRYEELKMMISPDE